MSNRGLPKHRVHKRAVKPGRKLSLRRLSAYVGLCLGAVVLAVVVLILGFGGAILNRYGKAKAERAFAQAHPGCALRIGELVYTVSTNCLVAQSVTLSATNSTLKVSRISLTGVRWARLLWGTAALADVLAKASLDATNLNVEFPQAQYGIRCARLRASVTDSELIAEGTELRTLVGDEEFFAAHEFRTTRFHVVVPECRVLGLAYGELLQGKSCRAGSVHFSQPSFEALVNRDKPKQPFAKSPLMVHEALAAIRQPLQVDSLSITNGHLTYCERVVAEADPGVLTFAAVNMSIEGIANRGDASAAILLRAQGDLMNAGTLKVLMTIPITPADFSFHYSGSLSAMDLTRLDAFLDIAEHTRIKSGSAQEVTFEVDVTAGQARGRVRAIYKDLEMALLDKQTGTEKGLDNRVASFLMNALKIRNSNTPDAAGLMKEGEVNYTRRPQDEFLQFAWFALRTGVLDVISQ
ncbi:MAG: hypothetical protein MUF81_14865 [Verrucomicrobia bacterium]|jgi:hypothetical protein|nr:hypothetical protein [Verrucomicrobiota bacterium]